MTIRPSTEKGPPAPPLDHAGDNTSNARNLLRAAMRVSGRKWRPVPNQKGTKRPAVADWENALSADVDETRALWSDGGTFHDHNVGIACGPSGLVVLDLDVKGGQDGPADLRALCTELGVDHAALCETYTVRTPSGGRPLYFRAPAGVEIRNSKPAPGIDVRAHGGQVLAEGSVNGAGAYVVERKLPVAELPPALVAHLSLGGVGSPSPAPPIPDVIPEGERETQLMSLAGSMRRRGLNADEIRAALDVVNLRCPSPLADHDLDRLSKSAARYDPANVPRSEREETSEYEQVKAKRRTYRDGSRAPVRFPAQALADVAAATVRTLRALRRVRERTAQLQAALDSRVIVEQAKGVLAEREGLTVSAAFDLMRRYARSNQLLLRDVAREVVRGQDVQLPQRIVMCSRRERPGPGAAGRRG